MSNEHPVENLMRSTMENLRNMVDVNTVVGEPIETKDGAYIIPISKVTFGFASGGTEFGHPKLSNEAANSYPFGGGSGAGVTVKPVAFLVVRNDTVRLMPVEVDTTYDRIVDTVPQVIDMVMDLVKKMSNKKSGSAFEYSTEDTPDTFNE
ncbi:MAG: GerW family sporulation protein [Clostridium sp.]